MITMATHRWPNEETKRYPVIDEQSWSTVPKEPANPEPRLLTIDDDAVKDILIAHIAMDKNANMFAVWIPTYAEKSPAAALGWGYTLIRGGDDIYSFQRVVFIPDRVTPIAECAHGKFFASSAYALSAW